MQTITVKVVSNGSGRSQRIATGGGRQRTVSVDFAKSHDWNKGNAAGTLANVLGWQPTDDIRRGPGTWKFTNHTR